MALDLDLVFGQDGYSAAGPQLEFSHNRIAVWGMVTATLTPPSENDVGCSRIVQLSSAICRMVLTVSIVKTGKDIQMTTVRLALNVWDELRDWASQFPHRPQPILVMPYRTEIRNVRVDKKLLLDFRLLSKLSQP